MKNLISALILVASSMVAGQRPSFAGLSPIGFPILENRTTTTPDPLGNRFGEGNTLPIEANGDWDLVDRLSKLPIDKQPFWFINWQAYDKHRKEPQTYPQRPSSFAESANTNNGQANTQFSTQTNPGFVTPGNNELINRFDPTTSSNQPNNNFNNNFTNRPSSNFNNNFNATQTVNPITNIYPTSDVYQNTNSNSYPNSNTNAYPNTNNNVYPNTNNNVYPNTNNNVYPNTNSNVYPNSNTNSNAYPGSNSNWNVQVTGNTYPNLLPNGSTNSNSFSNGNPNSLPNANSNLNVYPNVNVNPSNYPAPNTNSNQFQTSNFNTNSNPSIGNRFGDFIQTTQKYQWTPNSSTTKVVPTNYNNNPQYNTRTDNYQQRPEYAFY